MRRLFFVASSIAAVAQSYNWDNELAQLDASFDSAAVGKVASTDTKGLNKRVKDSSKTPYDREKEAKAARTNKKESDKRAK